MASLGALGRHVVASWCYLGRLFLLFDCELVASSRNQETATPHSVLEVFSPLDLASWRPFGALLLHVGFVLRQHGAILIAI